MTRRNDYPMSELYSAYGAGSLDPAFALLVETQAMLRPDLCELVAASEAVSGALLETAEPAAMRAGALDSTMALIDALSPAAPRAGAIEDVSALPEPIRRAAGASSRWKASVPGIRRMSLEIDSPMHVELYRIEPGAAVPRHSHAGIELTLVIAGGFSDALGSYGPGDLVVNGPDDTHRPVGDEGDICFALALRDGGLKFTGPLGMIQRLLGQ
ncbi:ChrR family anti-sigma-E factor [Hyphomonas sp. BRH_c22]|uniref:ChrR family anti-sigma-E factor n=1 Tax=Hyphomonas sp. BRH_c22 TaxID=1629710 RepID=UPI000A84E98E|nr:ChrR family anti-sigma-E factor [Hyphomonas sp. BRH_c22]